jgi:hypothetical protein
VRSAASREPRRALALLLGLWLTGCTHTYIYGKHAPPTFERGELVVQTSSGKDRFTVRRVGVASDDEPFSFRPPTSDEIRALRGGVVPDGVHTMRIEVDNAGVLWRDWGLASFGVGASTVLATVVLTGVVKPDGQSGGLTLPLTLVFAVLVGAEFMLIGLGLGAGMESGETDMRYRAFADD